ncbi:MAG: SAM-dependent chlorinase/fluorinase [Actinobacteria bacterium]|nr:SAM-dependent chlorinase/fluorinase [Actinomycetota bacterium]
MKPVITFLSDFGLTDTYTGICRAVIAGIAPDAAIVDLTHTVPALDVCRGATALADCVSVTQRRRPHLAVVVGGRPGDRPLEPVPAARHRRRCRSRTHRDRDPPRRLLRQRAAVGHRHGPAARGHRLPRAGAGRHVARDRARPAC